MTGKKKISTRGKKKLSKKALKKTRGGLLPAIQSIKDDKLSKPKSGLGGTEVIW